MLKILRSIELQLYMTGAIQLVGGGFRGRSWSTESYDIKLPYAEWGMPLKWHFWHEYDFKHTFKHV